MRIAKHTVFLFFLFFSPSAISADWGGMQVAVISFVDIGAVAAKTMSVCEEADLTDQERGKLRAAYKIFQEEHLPHKEEIREVVTSYLEKHGEDGREMLKAFQDPDFQKGITEQFLTKNEKGARGYCAIIFLEMLSGTRMALNLNYYAMQIHEYGNLKVFLPSKIR